MCRIIPRPLFIGISVMPLSFLWLSALWDLLKVEGDGSKMRMIRDRFVRFFLAGKFEQAKFMTLVNSACVSLETAGIQLKIGRV